MCRVKDRSCLASAGSCGLGEDKSAGMRKLLSGGFAMTLALLVMLPAAASSRNERQRPMGGLGFSVRIEASCTLSLLPGGTFGFAAVSGLGGNARESTAENTANVNCFNYGTATLAITDGALTGTTTYKLTSGAHGIPYEICATASQTACYTNSNTGFSVFGVSATRLYGCLPTLSATAPGSYSDTVSVTLTF